MTVADAIAKFLSEKGISHAFGIIGAGNAALFDAIARHAKTEIICCHHEAAAVMSATYYGRTLGSCGVAIVTTGAGSSNAITGALAANMDHAPVLIISGNEPSRYSKDDSRIRGVQGFATAKAVRRFVKWSSEVGDPIFTPIQELDIAYRAASAAPSGAAWIDVPRDYFSAAV